MERQSEGTRQEAMDIGVRSTAEHAAPRTTLESQIAELWSEILGVEKVGIRDNFFRLGGDSLTGIQFIARLASRLGLELSLRELFENPTIEQLRGSLTAAAQTQFPPPYSDTEPVPLSSAQRRLWFIDRLKGGSAAYHISEAFRIHGPLNQPALESALDSLLRKHEALRTVFVEVEGEPTQKILASSHFPFESLDLRSAGEENSETAVDRLVADESVRPFDLSRGPLVRGLLIRLAEDEWTLLIVMHHTVSDGWSLGVFNRELTRVYREHSEGFLNTEADLPVQYADFARWQQRRSTDMDVKGQLMYWKQYLQGAPELLELPVDRPRPALQSQRGESIPFVLGPSLTSRLKSLCNHLGVTLSAVLYSALALVLSKLSSQDDVVIGMPMANRRIAQLEGLIGFFVNTSAIRVKLDGTLSTAALIRRVAQSILDATENQDVPFEDIVEALQPVRSLRHSPIFQVMFAVQNVPQTTLELHGCQLTRIEISEKIAEFDLLFTALEIGGAVSGRVVYARELFYRSTIERWLEHLQQVLTLMSDNTIRTIDEYQLATRTELEQIKRFNSPVNTTPIPDSITRLFERQASIFPDRVAIAFEDRLLTYAQLDVRATQLARYLIEHGARLDEPIAICLERGVDAVVGLLGILKARGAYVPLDPLHPASRLTYIVGDTNTRFIVTQHSLMGKIEATDTMKIALDSDWDQIAKHNATDAIPDTSPSPSRSLAYIIYTSGSTGLPKGVLVEHRNVVNHWQALEPLWRHPVDCRRIALNAPITFDASVQQWVQLLSGCSLFIVPMAARVDPMQLLQFIDRHQIEGIDCTPSQLGAWVSVGLLARRDCSVRTVLVGGEAIDSELWSNLGRSTDIAFYNVYGPTECTVDSTFGRLCEVDPMPHIGHPMTNTRVYILDAYRRPAPIGVRGEIYIGGAGVSRGYLNRPDLTAERFLPDHFHTEASALMYRTGDIGRWRSDGTVEYLGRNDDQVKIRGFRIELGEIEAHIVGHPLVSEATVLALEGPSGEKRLVAYLVLDRRNAESLDDLKSHLRASLPAHMMPSGFVLLDQLPLTSSGKVDRAALIQHHLQTEVVEPHEQPMGTEEQALARLWQELLPLAKFGRNSSFFEVGGHSLLAVKLLFRINQAFGSAWTVPEIYKNPTIRDQAVRLQGKSMADEMIDLTEQASLTPDTLGVSLTPKTNRRNIFLTGATGFVGRFLLAQLIHDSNAKIYCLVRGESPQHGMYRLKSVLGEWNLWQDDFESRLVPIHGDVSLPRMGCDASDYKQICEGTDVIYHCATRVNHLETYAMAKAANVDSTRELLKIATSDTGKLINYISTLGVFTPTGTAAHRLVNERSSIDHEQHPRSRGYAASKWVSEKILLKAMDQGVPCNIFRLGLVWADTQMGRYDMLQREYRILKSSLLSGYGIENYRCGMPPTPVDYVVRAVTFLAKHHPHGGELFHISSANQDIGGLFERYNALRTDPLTLMPFREWVARIRQLHIEGRSLPIVPLLEGGSPEEFGLFTEESQPAGGRLEIDSTWTRGLLEQAGIVAPVLDDKLLTATLEAMISRDTDVRDGLQRRPRSGARVRYA